MMVQTVQAHQKFHSKLPKTQSGGDVCITEYNEKSFVNGILEEGGFKMLVTLVSDGTITLQQAAEKAGLDEASFTKRMNGAK